MELRRLLLRGAVGSLCATAAIAVYALLAGDFDETEGRILATTGAISAYGLIASPFPLLLERRRSSGVAYAGLSITVAAFLLALALIWVHWDEDGDEPWRAWIAITAFAAALSQAASLLVRRPGRRDPVAGVRGTAIALGFVLATLIAIAALWEPEGDGFYRVLGALGVLDVLALALIPVLTRLRGDVRDADMSRFRCTREDGSTHDVSASGFDEAARQAGGAVRSVERLGPA